MSSESTGRRTQEMRSAETRAKILDATLECLIEQGYSATSTPEVCRRAGVSRGALLHHFPTKAELVVHAVSHLAALRATDTRPSVEAVSGAGDPLDAVFETVWNAFFEGPLFHAALELWVAARCDSELHAALYPVDQVMGKAIRRAYEAVAPGVVGVGGGDAETKKRYEDLVTLTLHLLRGMALQKILKDDDENRRRLFELWKTMAREYLTS
ncbi:MAG: TetR/AcrR family transcriptional regulator [Myxococcales bacterium]|nr:TetR/AcrR family transcriptional regulator [Myxococcales bacterium]